MKWPFGQSLKLRSQGTLQPRDFETKKLRTKKPRNQRNFETKKPRSFDTKKPRTKKPRNQETPKHTDSHPCTRPPSSGNTQYRPWLSQRICTLTTFCFFHDTTNIASTGKPRTCDSHASINIGLRSFNLREILICEEMMIESSRQMQIMWWGVLGIPLLENKQQHVLLLVAIYFYVFNCSLSFTFYMFHVLCLCMFVVVFKF